jgi:hypothetical protein
MNDHRARIARAVDKALEDAAFRRRLLADPHTALVEAGIPVPPGLTVTVLEDTENLVHLVLPRHRELSEAELDKVAAGAVGPCEGKQRS